MHARPMARQTINRRIGGLEIAELDQSQRNFINRRIGGLEKEVRLE